MTRSKTRKKQCAACKSDMHEDAWLCLACRHDQRPKEERKLCVSCRSEMHPQAWLCPTCGTYQVRWRRRAAFFAGLGGLVTVLIALATYVSTNYDAIRETLFGTDELIVLKLDLKTLRVVNFGYRDLYLEGLEIRAEADGALKDVISVDAYVPKSTAVAVELRTALPEKCIVGAMSADPAAAKVFEAANDADRLLFGGYILRGAQLDQQIYGSASTRPDALEASWVARARGAVVELPDMKVVPLNFVVDKPCRDSGTGK